MREIYIKLILKIFKFLFKMDLHGEISYYITNFMNEFFNDVQIFNNHQIYDYHKFTELFLSYFNNENFKKNIMPVYLASIDDQNDELIDLLEKEFNDLCEMLFEFYPILKIIDPELPYDDYMGDIVYNIIVPYFQKNDI